MDPGSRPPTPDPLPSLIDTHAHLDSFSDPGQVIEKAHEAGVQKIIVAAFNIHCSKFNVGFVEKHNSLFASVGVHPNSANELDAKAKEDIKALAQKEKVKAIGETGLDFHHQRCEKNQQVEAFKFHIDLAKKLNLPLIIHSREAVRQTLEILKEQGWPKSGLVFHAFGGTVDEANEIFSNGGLISITGVVTFKNAPELQELVKQIDLENIMLETDSPYLSPEPYRGKINEPANVAFVAKKIAELKEVSIEKVVETTTKTAERFFGI